MNPFTDRKFPPSIHHLWRKKTLGMRPKVKIEQYEDHMTVFMLFSHLLSSRGVQPRGVIYLGANVGQLLWPWIMMSFKEILMVEPQDKAFAKLRENTEVASQLLLAYEEFTRAEPLTNIQIAQCAIGRHDGDSEFHVTANSCLGSLLPPMQGGYEEGALNLDGEMRVVEKKRVPIFTLDSFLQNMGPDASSAYNLLYMNVQGSELQILEGARKTLPYLDLVYLEVNYSERYQGCPKAREFDDFLADFRYEPVWGFKNPRLSNGFLLYHKKA